MSRSDDAEELLAQITAARAGMRAMLAAWQDDVDMMATDMSIRRHPAVTADFDFGGELVDLRIEPSALTAYTHLELQQLIADVINAMRERLMMRGRRLIGYVDNVIGDTVEVLDQIVGETTKVEAAKAEADEVRTYAESSRDGTLALALDQRSRVLWCRLEPEVSKWAPEVLADRIKHLYTLAQMRVWVDLRRLCDKEFGSKRAAEMFSKLSPPVANQEALKSYRHRHMNF
ncbi:hypothetical protein [Mycobacterium intracellulare]|uniref:hypothetical protein n=1 Tax=Mycobacterium intracellulare TaxID=1767 RepID=UPI000C7C1B3B|nr:hypothetical protein [Mycobacterium intracellulare]